jgi:hypothetical protein
MLIIISETEIKLYKILQQGKATGFPMVYHIKQRNNYNMMFMELLG